MYRNIRKTAVTIAAVGALGLGGGAAVVRAAGDPDPTSRSANVREQRDALSSEVAAKVEAAALAEVPGATVLRTEAGGPYSTPYHAHVRTASGAFRVVLVDSSFKATAVGTDRGRGMRGGGHGGRHGGAGETALTGATRQKVEAAVRAEYPSATIVRTETNGDASASYESHIETSGGGSLEVLVSSDFKIVDARQHGDLP